MENCGSYNYNPLILEHHLALFAGTLQAVGQLTLAGVHDRFFIAQPSSAAPKSITISEGLENRWLLVNVVI